MRTPSDGDFLDLATRFQRIADEFTRADRDSPALVSSLRDLAAGAGTLLIGAVRDGSLPPPDNEGSWLRLALRSRRAHLPRGQPPSDGRYQKAGRYERGFRVAYRDLRGLEGVSQVCSSSNSTPREQLEGLAVHLSGLLWSVGGKRGAGVAAKDAGACLMRFVFGEAATAWLRERYYPHEPAVDLARCEVEFADSRGKLVTMSLPLDSPASGDTPADEAWRQVAVQCAAACRVLGALVAPEGVDETPTAVIGGSGAEATGGPARTPAPAGPPVDLNDSEQNILGALGDDVLTGEELSKKLRRQNNSNFRSTLAGLVKRGILKRTDRGYRRAK